ncbi:unnamed protein product [Prorocentrum cordatum]|uniref:Uncharacterized protein n=1 Tax=Prorocentrum cordatum TaxID=2364126 RepID=A0ABN9X8F5_9DINO|nr:unnamed protein product [Polarella glacialis]
MRSASHVHPFCREGIPSPPLRPPLGLCSVSQPARGAEGVPLREGPGPGVAPARPPGVFEPVHFCGWCGARVAAELAFARCCTACGGKLRNDGPPAVPLRPASVRGAQPPPVVAGCGPRPPFLGTVDFESPSLEKRRVAGPGPGAMLKRDEEQSLASPASSCPTPYATLRKGLGPAASPSPDSLGGLSSEQRRALIAKTEACLHRDMDKLRERAKRHISMVEEASQGTVQDQPKWLWAPTSQSTKRDPQGESGAAVPVPLKLVASLPAEQRRALMVKLECRLPDDVEKLLAWAAQDFSTAAKTPEGLRPR